MSLFFFSGSGGLDKSAEVAVSLPKRTMSGGRTPAINTQYPSCYDNYVRYPFFIMEESPGRNAVRVNVDRRLELRRCAGVVSYPTNRCTFKWEHRTGNRPNRRRRCRRRELMVVIQSSILNCKACAGEEMGTGLKV